MKKTIRYKKPTWSDWVYLSVDEDKLDAVVAKLTSQGYEVEEW